MQANLKYCVATVLVHRKRWLPVVGYHYIVKDILVGDFII